MTRPEHPESSEHRPPPVPVPPSPMPEQPTANPFAAPLSPSGGPLDESPDAPLAGRGARLGASILDNLIVSGVVLFTLIPLGLLGVLGSVQDVDDATAAFGGIAAILGMGFVFLIYGGIQAYLLSTRGQTIGKMITRVRIVKLNGNPAGFLGAVFLRIFVSSLLFGGIAIVAMFALGDEIGIVGNIANIADSVFIFRDDRRCIHDLIAGTKVVRA